ncbi:MAG: hypothetical protein GQ561_00095 [Calditrichae bacterium]|nr:hypothetical protein [Calditrichia bacterium]
MIRERSNTSGSRSLLPVNKELMQKLQRKRGMFTRKPIRLSKTFLLSLMLFLLMNILFLSGCMHMGMSRGHTMMKPMKHGESKTVQQVNKGKAIEQMIEEAVLDLAKQDIGITTLAVWQIKSQTAGVDVEMVRQKLIARLAGSDRFKVISRERLSDLLKEQSLSLSGTVDEKSAVEIGKLIGVEGFIDGYASLENDRFILSFKLIESKSGVILWAKTIERSIQ